MLKLNGKLFRFTCEGTYNYDIKKNPEKTKEADPLTLTLTCAQNLFVDRTFIN